MDKKKVLIVSGSFYPVEAPRSFRTTELAKELALQGHEVVVYIPFKGHDHSDFSKEHGITFKDLGKLWFPEIKIESGKVANIISRLVRRFLLMLFEYPAIELMFKVNKALRKESGYDLLISVAVPHPIHWGVAWARSAKHPIAKIWVADCGDPYMGERTDSFRKLFYFKYVEKWFMRKADYISIPRIEMKPNYYAEFHKKIKEIPQGFNFDELVKFEGPINNPAPTFAFAGNFIRTVRNPTKLMSFLASLDCDFKFVVYTRTPELLRPFMKELGAKLEIKSYLPRKDLFFELSKMDFLINISFDPRHQSPSKLIDYALAGRPILNITDELDTKVVGEFLRGDYSRRFIIDDIQKYNIVNVTHQFLDLA